MKKPIIARLTLVGVLLLFAQGCATNPVSGKSELALSESWELSAGAKYHQEILKQYQVYEDPALQEYVNEIGQKLAAKSHRPDLNFTFTLLDSPQVNAFALPGGYIYVTRGIMAYMNREAHLAGVIGHEIGHVTARHGAQRAAQQQIAGVATAAVAIGTGSGDLAQMSQMLGGALLSGYGRTQELQSDRLGAEYIAKNNYDPEDMIGVIGLLKDQELYASEKARAEGREPQAYHGLFASHPRNDQRLQEVIKAAAKFRDSSQPEPDDGRFLKLTDGMSFGESESQGITRGNKFYHKDLDLYLEFPRDWKIANQPAEIIAIAPDNTQAIRMRMISKAPDVPADQYLSSNFQGFRDGRQVSTSEDQAYAGVATLSDKNTGKSQNVRVSAVYRGEQAFLLLGQGSKTLPNENFFDVVSSVRRLKNNEKELASGHNIKLVTVREGDTFAKLAARSKYTEDAEAQLRLINNMYPSGEPIPGQQIKVIQ
ncbi:MAG: M48 family metalloprotease [Gammaproteobacteria bacterium]|nr:M48 family metalloprotease [Gammaproteobacteria bacterium]